MKTLNDILIKQPEIEIGGERFRLLYNNFVLANSPVKIDLTELMKMAELPNSEINEKLKTFINVGSDAIEMIMAGIKTDIIVKNEDQQCFETGLFSEVTEKKLVEVRTMLIAGYNIAQLIELFVPCIQALVDFMPKVVGGEGESPSLSPRGGQKG